MKKIYVLGPLAGLIVFSGFYWKHAQVHEAQLVEAKRQDDLARQEKLARQAEARTRAEEQARVATAKRNQERAEKEKIEEAQKQAKGELEQRRNTAAEQAQRLRPQIDRLRSDLATVQAAIARGEERRRELQQERAFLMDYVKQAETNRNSFYRLLENLEAVEGSHATATGPSNRNPADRG